MRSGGSGCCRSGYCAADTPTNWRRIGTNYESDVLLLLLLLLLIVLVLLILRHVKGLVWLVHALLLRRSLPCCLQPSQQPNG
jgi:hypothetical protein